MGLATVEERQETKTQPKLQWDNPVVTVMRVKNEARYIEHALRSLEPLGGEVLLLDDGSTDATANIVGCFGNVHYRRQDDVPLDEGRDRTALYRWALEFEPEWIFTLDGDEVLDGPSADRIVRAMTYAESDINVFKIFGAVMASEPNAKRQFRRATPRGVQCTARLFRVRDADPNHIFTSDYAHGFHCGCIPKMANRITKKLNAWFKHYGRETKEQIETKREFYNTHDPGSQENTDRVAEDQLRGPIISWVDGPDCREMGMTGTVTY